MPLNIPVVFDPISRLVIEDTSGAQSPFEALSDNNIDPGSFVNMYWDSIANARKVRLANAVAGYPAMGFTLDPWVNNTTPMVVNTGGINNQVNLIQGDGSGDSYTFLSADIGSSVFLDNHLAGKITTHQPTDSPNYQRIGEVINVTNTNIEIAFRPTINQSQDVLSLKGTWDASTNIPTLSNTVPVGSRGWYYIVSHAGDTLINGINTWNAGDWIISDGTNWSRVQNTVQLQLTPNPGGISPKALGTAAIGTDTNAAHSDHVHPFPTALSLQTLVLAAPGDAEPLPASPTAATQGTAALGSREDHIHPTNVVKSPIRYYYESSVLTTDNQPVMRIDGPGSLRNIFYYSGTPGTGTLVIKINGTIIATIGLTSGDTGFIEVVAFTPITLHMGDVVSMAVTASGSASLVTVQLDIEQYA